MSKHLQKISFFLDHPRGSVFKNDILDEFLLLKSPSRNSSDLQVFRVFPHVKTSSENIFFFGSSSWIGIQERHIRRVSPAKIP